MVRRSMTPDEHDALVVAAAASLRYGIAMDRLRDHGLTINDLRRFLCDYPDAGRAT